MSKKILKPKEKKKTEFDRDKYKRTGKPVLIDEETFIHLLNFYPGLKPFKE